MSLQEIYLLDATSFHSSIANTGSRFYAFRSTVIIQLIIIRADKYFVTMDPQGRASTAYAHANSPSLLRHPDVQAKLSQTYQLE